MKSKRILITLLLLGSFTVFSQQIGDGHASTNYPTNFSLPLLSGIYNGLNASGTSPDTSSPWQHLIVARHADKNNDHQLQISSSFSTNDRLFFRKIAEPDSTPSTSIWNEIATRGSNTFVGNQVISNGNVGIGTGNATPSEKLEVTGNAKINGKITSSISSNEGGAITLYNGLKNSQKAAENWTIYNMTAGYNNSLQFWAYGNNGYDSGAKMILTDEGNLQTYGGIGIKTGLTGDFVNSPAIAIGDTDTGFKQQGDGELAVFTNNNEVARFKPNGYVGIGTTTPSEKLEVTGNAKINGNVFVS
ncbi:MAG: hypothetical protein QG594_2453, partial [Bacteroidota bacterium]|nr:hypothetical protein [Bacteroidota bacterium]